MNANLIRGQVDKHLRERIRYNGKITTNKELYLHKLNNGCQIDCKIQVKYRDRQVGVFSYKTDRVETKLYIMMEKDGTFIEIPKIIYDKIKRDGGIV